MHKLPTLSPGDSVKLIAPASGCAADHLTNLINLLESWDLKCIVDETILGRTYSALIAN